MENKWSGRAERDIGSVLALIDGAPQNEVSADTHKHVHVFALS